MHRCRASLIRCSSAGSAMQCLNGRRAAHGARESAGATLEHTHDSIEWYSPADERLMDGVAPATGAPPGALRSGRVGSSALRAALGLAVPVRGLHAGAQRTLGYCACPCSGATRDRVGERLGRNDGIDVNIGYVASPQPDQAFKRELAAELDRLRRSSGRR